MDIKYLGEQTISYLIKKCKATFASITHTHTATEVGADASGSASKALSNAKAYTNEQIGIVSDTLSTHTGNNTHITSAERTKWNAKVDKDVTDALNDAIGTKANASDLTDHTGNKENPHGVTKAQLSLGNVENKSSATIRSEITKSNVTTALGYTPYTQTEVDSLLDVKVDKVSGKGLSTKDYTEAEQIKLSEIDEGAQVNQNAFSNVKVGSTTVSADTTTDTLEIAAGTGISVAGDATNDKVTITNSGVRSVSTGSTNGTISVNTGGTSTDIAVKGLGSAAYTASGDYAAKSHGTHVTWSTTSPKMNGTATVGSETKVARGDHVHPTDTSRASQADLDALEEIVENHTHNYAGSNEPGGAANSAKKLTTARKIGDTTFDGTADISLENIIGRGYCSSSSNTNQGKYQKFARINVSDAAWSGCFGTFIVKDVESNHINGQLTFHVRSNSTIASVNVTLIWTNVTIGYESSVVAVKVSDGIYDLYYKSVGTYEIASFRLIDCTNRNKITLYGNQGWVDSVDIADTSSLGGNVLRANKLNTNAGSATQPVYFSGGIPVACTNTLGKSVPSDAVFTDGKVSQAPTSAGTTNANYRLLLSGSADDTSHTEGSRKDPNLYFNPSTGVLTAPIVKLGDATISYDTTEKAIVFNFE